MARLAFKINVQCTYGFLRFVRIAEMDVLVGRGSARAPARIYRAGIVRVHDFVSVYVL